MKSVNASELNPGDVIFFATLRINPRRKIISAVNHSDGQIEIRFQDAGVAFLKPEQRIQVFELNEILHCVECNRDTDHCLGNCNECGDDYTDNTKTKVDPNSSSASSTQSLPPPPVIRRSPSYGVEQSRPQIDSSNIAALVATAVGTFASIGGIVQIGLAIWLYHLTDTGRVDGLESVIRTLESESGVTTQNEFHVIAFGIGTSGLLFTLLGIGLFTTLWATGRS
jgi:hypothetical protein